MTNLLLYLIRFLHQTTTSHNNSFTRLMLYLIRFLHQTTTFMANTKFKFSCILFVFYIKPQRR